ncbi:YuzF family protein [Novibacillus thermophilus]|jgi:hypothetical protein
MVSSTRMYHKSTALNKREARTCRQIPNFDGAAYNELDKTRRGVTTVTTMNHWHTGDSYLYQSLMPCVHQPITVQTTRGSVRGILRSVTPDHLVVEMGGNWFFIRTQQIIWFVPYPRSYKRMRQLPPTYAY